MHIVSKLIAAMLIVFLGGIFGTVILPRVYAAGSAADAMCLPQAIPPCPCGQNMKMGKCQPDPTNKFGCPCGDNTSGFSTQGKCVATFKCLAESTDGKPPEMPKLPEPKQPPPDQGQNQDPCATGGAGGNVFASPSTSTSAASSTCPQSGYYQPPVSSGFDSSIFNTPSNANASVPDLISSLLAGNSNSSNASGGTGTIVPGSSSVTNGTAATGSGNAAPAQAVGVSEGVVGDIRVIGNGVTILASNRDSTINKAVSGFTGAIVSTGATAQAIYTTMCATRPWSTNFLANIVPVSFFDGLCTVRGYRVGPAPVTQVTTAAPAAKPKPAVTTTAAPVIPAKPVVTVTPQVDIWAVPAAVPKGSRATIFWSSKNAESCAVASGDGRFSETGLTGGKASSALSVATTFTISCTSSSGTHATDFVTVGLSQ